MLLKAAKVGDVALAGPDGERAALLLRRAKREGAAVFSNLARVAVSRLAERSDSGLGLKRLFNDGERRVLAGVIAATNATAELLGRSRVRERWLQVLRKHEPQKLAEMNLPPHVEFFDDPDPRIIRPMPPEKALAYFQRLVPTISVKKPERFGQLLERRAFTLAVDADQKLLDTVKGLIQERIETGVGISTAPAEIESLLTDAGVSPRNPQYAEMVQRTNMMDSYNTGIDKEMKDPDVKDIFPVWRYLGIKDGRQGKDHEPQFDNYYSNDLSFSEVRGDRVFNCRCGPQPIDKFLWRELQGKGATVSTFAEAFAAGTCQRGQTQKATGCVPATPDGGGGSSKPRDRDAVTKELGQAQQEVSRAFQAHQKKPTPQTKAALDTASAKARELSTELEGAKRTRSRAKPATAKVAAPEGPAAKFEKTPDGKYGKSKAKVEYKSTAGKGNTDQVMRNVLGDKASPETVASLVGAPDDAKVQLSTTTKGNLHVTIKHKAFEAVRFVGKDGEGKLFIRNEEFFMKATYQGSGVGSDVFSRQVEQARETGVSYIACHAAKANPSNPDKPHNGYYTWPRMGYDQPVSAMGKQLALRVQKQFPDAQNISDVMSTKEGRDWWKKNGKDLESMRFDLKPGSKSLRILEAYQQERAKRKAG